MKRDRMTMEQFKEMPLKSKIQWLIHYYGLIAVVVVIGILVLGNFLHTILFPAPEPDGHVIILSDDITASEAVTFEEELEALTGKSISVEQFYPSDVYGQAAFSAKMGVDQVDIMITPPEETAMMEESGVVREKRKIDRGDLYLCVHTKARDGEVLDSMLAYFDKQF